MPNKCVVPGCKTNYKGFTDNAPVFRFPIDPARQRLWLKLISREDFTPTENSRVCSKHFLDKFLTIYNAKSKQSSKKRARLTSDAYPTVFNEPCGKSRRTIRKRSIQKLIDVQKGCKNAVETWMSTDKISSFSSFCQEAKDYLGGDRWVYKKSESSQEYIQFGFLQDLLPNDNQYQKHLFTVTVFSDMQLEVFCSTTGYIPARSLSGIFGSQSPPILVYWSQFVAVITQCSTGFWFNSSDVCPSVCITDCHQLSPLEPEYQLIGESNEEDPAFYTFTTETIDVAVGTDCEQKLRNENLQLTQKLHNAVFQRNMLLKRLKTIQDLASIDLDLLSLVQVMDGNPEGRHEMKKVYELIETIMNTDEMTAEHDVIPHWIDKNSKLIQDDDLLQTKFPTFHINSSPISNKAEPSIEDDTRETIGEYNHDDGVDNMADQSLVDNVAVPDNEESNGDEQENGLENEKRAKTKRFPCEYCGNTFSGQRAVSLHIFYVHNDRVLPQKQCWVCGKKFLDRSRLKAHIVVHSNDKNYLCDICGKTVKRSGSLAKHMKYSHSEERPYICSLCGNSFKRNDFKSLHEKSCTGIKREVLHCNFCDKQFTTKRAFEKHLESHPDEKAFQCNVCNKLFRLSSSLRRHLIGHKEETPFECSLCPAKFKFRNNFKRHQLEHVDVGHFTCDVCGRRFKWMKSLKKHQNFHKRQRIENSEELH